MLTWAIVLAAGTGERLGAGTAKAFVELAGRPLLERSLESVEASRSVVGAVLVVPDALMSMARAVARPFSSVQAVVPGGPTRHESVAAGLEVLPEQVEVIVCHDAARPFAGPALFDRVVAALERVDAAGVVPVLRSPDTVKRVREGMVLETLPREEVALVQTPQTFVAPALREAHRQAARTGLAGTDDAMLLEAAGYRVAVVEGSPTNFKITTPADLERAEQYLSGRLLPGEIAGG